MLVEDSLADLVILREKSPQRRNRANGGASPHLDCLVPLFHILLRFVLYADAISTLNVDSSL
jgi:hypothetical protein